MRHYTEHKERYENYQTNQLIGAAQKEKEEEQRVNQENEKNASAAYVPPDSYQLQDDGNESGLPWGSMPIGYMISGQNETKKSSSSNQGAAGTTDALADKEKEESSTKASGKDK
jgi:hypothetical protein